jgi:hypothetical protein
MLSSSVMGPSSSLPKHDTLANVARHRGSVF